MFNLVRSIFAVKDRETLSEAESEFDELMTAVDRDMLDLDHLSHHVNNEFDGIGEEIESISKEVDELTSKRS